MDYYQKVRFLVKKLIYEALDWHNNISKPQKQSFEVNPSRMTRTVDIGGIRMIISILFNNYEKSAHVSFVEEGQSFDHLTGANVIAQVLSNATIHTLEMIEDFNKKLYGKTQITLDTLTFTPTKMKGEEKLNPLQTKRGRIYKIFIEKYLKAYKITTDGENVIVLLKWPIVIGKNPTINRKSILKAA